MAAKKRRGRARPSAQLNQPVDDFSAQQGRWLAVIGRCLAYLCLQNSQVKSEKYLTTKAAFLEGLGLTRDEAAKLLGTTAESLRVLSYKESRQRKQGNVKTSQKARTE